jgi:NAD(P)-dependent dehydrogenase (short-subunit alcohol dehydrogenase family)
VGERLAGKVALVTGAGQSEGPRIGNGRATAILFAREGARVVLMDRDPESARETERAISEEEGEATTVAGDVSVEEDCRAAVAACLERFGTLNVVHHNVGVFEGDGWPENIELEAWERIMRVNAGGAMLIAKAAVPAMKEGGGGAITNVSSIAAVVAGTKGTSNPPLGYKMSKAAMNAITQSLAQTYAADGIRVNAILPGLIDTPMAIDNVVRALGVPREEWVERRNQAVPLRGGMGTAWDVANAALFLASDEARFITGVLLPVDGGQSSRVG